MSGEANRGPICVLGATGCIGIEVVAHLLRAGQSVIAVVRDEAKLARGLATRSVQASEETLEVMVADLFNPLDVLSPQLAEVLRGCGWAFNYASPALSWVPLSRANREWRTPVSSLTELLLGVVDTRGEGPHLVAFCGPERFEGHDGSVSPIRKAFSWAGRALYPALRDNYQEARLLLEADHERWTVLRCGSVRPGTGEAGDGSKVHWDPHDDQSDYRAGKGVALLAADLGAFITARICDDELSSLRRAMPFVFNTRF